LPRSRLGGSGRRCRSPSRNAECVEDLRASGQRFHLLLLTFLFPSSAHRACGATPPPNIQRNNQRNNLANRSIESTPCGWMIHATGERPRRWLRYAGAMNQHRCRERRGAGHVMGNPREVVRSCTVFAPRRDATHRNASDADRVIWSVCSVRDVWNVTRSA
jgi:hypothetical protein